MARSPIRIKTKIGRRLTGSCSQEQASRLMSAQRTPGAKKRDGNCTLQSAEYVLRFGAGTPFYYESKRERVAVQQEKPAPFIDYVPWWKTFGLDEGSAPRQLPSGTRSGAGSTRALPARQLSAREELGLDVNSKPTRAQVKDAFRKRALAVHPDHGGTSEDFRRALRARDVLLSTAR